ncbi:MAG: Membrane protein involved in the export of O-antigen and teichoic acid [Algoriphagus marincola HL-49]|uniref:Membrane protein involved in the export of O-antigen and teichoic acid n=1 Tax=Algoriphagus marincola HL-49 TaxID=1305737 RepID=A0A0P7XZF0_9BACT|nr:MAG: Membrane protein involved in the export of O-antigen and teichoic acid [Algoriphagus marincola HL-49]
MAALKIRILKGVFWNSLQVLINKSFSFLIKLVLAKILFPEEFGIVGMALVFTSFVEVFNDLGFGAALIQRKIDDLNENHFHTAFWTGVVWSLVIYQLMIFVISPFAASFYQEPLLLQIIPVLSISVLSSPVNLVHKAQLMRDMNFKEIAKIENYSAVGSGVLSLGLALSGAGVWSLVFNSVATFLISMPLYFRATKWRPKFIWSQEAFKDVFGFGIYTTGTNFSNNLINKLDYLFIGKFVSASALGAYTLAFVLTDTFRSQVMSIMNRVMYPVYGKAQEDIESIKRYYLNVVRYNSLIINPVMAVLFILGEPIINNFFGEKWIETIIPMKIIALSVIFHMMANSNTVLIRGMGKSKLEFFIQLFKAIFVFLPAISIGVYYYGIIGAAYAVLFNKIVSVIIAQYFLKKLINLRFSELLIALQAPLVGLMVSLFIGLILRENTSVGMIVTGLIMLIAYAGVIWMMIGNDLKKQYSEIKFGKEKVVN